MLKGKRLEKYKYKTLWYFNYKDFGPFEKYYRKYPI